MKIANFHLHNEVRCNLHLHNEVASLITYVTVPVERVSLLFI